MNSEELLSNKKALADAQALYRDLAAGDPYSLKRFEEMNLDMKAIKTALDFLMNSKDLNDAQKIDLLQNNWRVNYREKPPTPEEFLTEKYLGPTAATVMNRVRKVFIEFMDPTSPCRNLILYPHISWGKSFLSTLINLYIMTCCSLLRDPYKFFGCSPATVLAQMLISYSLGKSRELLLDPYLNMLEASPFFEKVQRKDTMKALKADFEHRTVVDKLYYTTADPTSEITFDSNINIKLGSSVQKLLGLSLICICLSELSFFSDAGKALYYKELVQTDKGFQQISDIKIGDQVLTPSGTFSPVISIPWEGFDDLYEIEFEDGRTVRCHKNHLWKVSYLTENGQKIEEIITTQFMIDHPEYKFDIPEFQ